MKQEDITELQINEELFLHEAEIEHVEMEAMHCVAIKVFEEKYFLTIELIGTNVSMKNAVDVIQRIRQCVIACNGMKNPIDEVASLKSQKPE